METCQTKLFYTVEKDKIFFASEGLTTTSANHIANLAKESYMALEQELDGIKFFSTEIGLLSSDSSKVLSTGVTESYLDTIQEKLLRIAKCKSLIAWLREAIKAKDSLIREAQNLSVEDIAKTLGLAHPEYPERYSRLTSDDIVATWNIKQRNHYYYLNTLCATIGMFIHPERTFSNARTRLCKVISEPNEVIGSGRDMVVRTYKPTVGLTKVEDTFFALQDKYRSYQAELNSLKHQIELALQADEREKSLKEDAEASEYANKSREITAQCMVYKNQAIQDAQALKITIPDSLKGIYQEIATQGKKA